MNYEKFKRELCRSIMRREEVAGKSVCLTGKDEDVLCITDAENAENVLCRRVAYLYQIYLERNLQCVVDEIVTRVRLQRFFKEYAVIMRPLNYAENCEELKDAVYRRFGDVTLVLYAVLYEWDREYVTAKLDRSMVEKWHIPQELLVEEAMYVTGRKRPPRLYYSTELECAGSLSKGIFMPDEAGEKIVIHNGDAKEGMRGYRLTALGHANGAVALFYPGVKERLAVLLEGDYYVGFTSVHEAVIHPVRCKVLGDMKSAIVRSNILCDPREKLTDRVYRYCSNQKRLVEV